ncbi:Alcohol dehydrogenase-like 4 [Apostasia shenzhenica]|uniref:Alcohol dehydrogenase-like 4 n=1 Tax=Apostasia shenzhenica TaxID=1088818 RepID=A0A2H9ZWT5_9ASPA|nr:Alcohol dehydrogenase-like 4 [Apostasia shenzhenica]
MAADSGLDHLSNGTHPITGRIITCKAAVVWGPGQPFRIEDIEVDPPKRLEVRLRILFTSICHTDLGSWIAENESQRAFPRILGHEAAGEVESVGEDVEGLVAGDKVVPVFNGECGSCRACRSEKTNLCFGYAVDPARRVMRADGAVRFFLPAAGGTCRRPIYHFLNTSTFSEYTVVDSACVVKIAGDSPPLSRLCLFSCGVSTGVGAAWNAAKVEEGSRVAVFGLGAVGLAGEEMGITDFINPKDCTKPVHEVAQGARLRGAAQIIGVDINPDKFTKGEEMGITDFINPKDCTKPVHEGWGLTVVLGVYTSPRMLPLHPMELFQRKITATVFGDFKPKSQLPNLINNYLNGEIKLNLDGLITHELPFAEINQAFKLLSEGKALRCLLTL